MSAMSATVRVQAPRGASGAALAVVALLVAAVALTSVQAGAAPARVLWLLLLAPLLEEACFRAGLHEALLRWRWQPLNANLAVALAFAAAHVAVRADAAALAVALPALLLGWLYQQRRSLRACVALHAAMNAAWLVLNLVVPNLVVPKLGA